MKTTKVILLSAALYLACGQTAGQPANQPATRAAGQQGRIVQREWTVGDTLRQALVWVPGGAGEHPVPLLFAFHGRGGTMQNFMNGTRMHELWPGAMVVYPQGLPWAGGRVGNGRPLAGWIMAREEDGGRDVRFFDTVLASLKKEYRIDEGRIYAMGHSNGGGFTYTLWALRGDVLAAVAPMSAAGRGLQGARMAGLLTPKPVFIATGEKDTLATIRVQRATIALLRELNGATGPGREIAEYVTLYDSPAGNPVETYIHPGGHRLPTGALPYVVGFFQAAVKK